MAGLHIEDTAGRAGRLVLLQASRNTKLPDLDWELWLVRLVRERQILGVLDSFGRVSSRAEEPVQLPPGHGRAPRAAAWCVRQGCQGSLVAHCSWPGLPDPQVDVDVRLAVLAEPYSRDEMEQMRHYNGNGSTWGGRPARDTCRILRCLQFEVHLGGPMATLMLPAVFPASHF